MQISIKNRVSSSDCNYLATKNENFVCINNGDYCQEVSQCKASSDPTNRRRLASDCSDLKTEDDGIFQCMGVDYCEEVLKTCDRIYFDAVQQDKSFILIDTGGIVEGNDDEFVKSINAQVNLAIDEADLILFVVDALSGLNPYDYDIANKLRSVNK